MTHPSYYAHNNWLLFVMGLDYAERYTSYILSKIIIILFFLAIFIF